MGRTVERGRYWRYAATQMMHRLSFFALLLAAVSANACGSSSETERTPAAHSNSRETSQAERAGQGSSVTGAPNRRTKAAGSGRSRQSEHARAGENDAVVVGAFIPNVLEDVRATGGRIRPDVVRNLVHFHRQETTDCYRPILAANTAATAVAALHFNIVGGVVQNLEVAVHGDQSDALQTCIRNHAAAWLFPSHPEPTAVEINYTLSPAERPSFRTGNP